MRRAVGGGLDEHHEAHAAAREAHVAAHGVAELLLGAQGVKAGLVHDLVVNADDGKMMPRIATDPTSRSLVRGVLKQGLYTTLLKKE